MTGSTTEGIFSGLALWLVASSSAPFSAALKEEMERLRNTNKEVCSGEFGIHATLLAGLGDRNITANGLELVAQQAVDEWKKEPQVKDKGLTVDLQDVTTKGSYFQVSQPEPP